MSDELVHMKVTAVAEVRDADGNLISSTPVELSGVITEAQKRELEGAQQ